MESNLIVEYESKAGFLEARREIEQFLEKLGDKSPEVELIMPGWLAVKTDIKNKEVIEELRDIFSTDPNSVKATKRWIPVDCWCDNGEVEACIKEEYNEILLPKDRYHINLEAHGAGVSEEDFADKIAGAVRAKRELDPVEKILRVHVFKDKTALSLNGRHNYFRKL